MNGFLKIGWYNHLEGGRGKAGKVRGGGIMWYGTGGGGEVDENDGKKCKIKNVLIAGIFTLR